MPSLLDLAIATAALAVPALAQDRPPGPPRGGMTMRADANGDGVVTRQEALAEAGARFDRMDANRDGRLDPAEMRAGPGRGRMAAPPAPPTPSAPPPDGAD